MGSTENYPNLNLKKKQQFPRTHPHGIAVEYQHVYSIKHGNGKSFIFTEDFPIETPFIEDALGGSQTTILHPSSDVR